MHRTRSSRALAGTLLVAVCGPITALGVAVLPQGGATPQARISNRHHQTHHASHAVYRGPAAKRSPTAAARL